MRPRALALLLLLLSVPLEAGELKPFARGSWQTLRQAHAGKPVIVHFWGLSCAPCLTELPKWSRLVREHRTALVFVAADPVAEDPARVTATLSKAGLSAAENWSFADQFTERLWFEVSPDWAGELPFTMLVGRDGKSTRIAGTADFAAINRWIDTQTKGARP